MNLNILPPFGSAIPGQGGYFAAILRGPTVDDIQQPPVALIVSDRTHHTLSTWGTYGRKLEGCDGRTDGQTNTLAMLADDCPAAKIARALTVDGHNDFFLPAIGQLNAAAATAPELFCSEAVVWSSTQHSSDFAIAQVFENGGSHWGYKDYEYLVVPVRVIQLQHLTPSTL